MSQLKKTLMLSSNRKLAGVCGGIADFLGWDATVVRAIWVVATVFSFGTLIIAYVICAFVFPK